MNPANRSYLSVFLIVFCSAQSQQRNFSILFNTFAGHSPSKEWKEIMNADANTGTKLMNKPHIHAVTRPARPLRRKLSRLLKRLQALGRFDFSRKISPGGSARGKPARRLDWKDPAKKAHPHSRPHWLVIAVRGFAQSYRSHPVKIQIENRK